MTEFKNINNTSSNTVHESKTEIKKYNYMKHELKLKGNIYNN